jgi:hypothetical protein
MIELINGRMNGYIKGLIEADQSFDNDGNPIGISDSFSSNIPCKYVSANRNDATSVGDGTFSQATYMITIRDMSFRSKQIKLFNSDSVCVCTKDIIGLEVLETVKRLKIII